MDDAARYAVGGQPHDSMRALDDFEDNVERAPGLVVMTGAVLAFVGSVAAFALGKIGIGIGAASSGMLILSAGLSWLSMERRRVRAAEREMRFDEAPRRAG